MSPEEQMELLDALIDGDITEADFLRLEAELSIDPAVRQAYYKRLKLDLLLEQEACEFTFELPSPSQNFSGSPVRPTFWLTGILIAIAAVLVLAVSLAVWRSDDGIQTAMENDTESLATGFAVLSGQSDAVWEGNSIRDGALLPEGQLHLVSGLIHVELFSGVQMVLEGDAVFSIESPMLVNIEKGRARAFVPEPAHGFRVKTSGGEVVDLGTEFTIDAGSEHSTVSVVDGEVELRPHDADSRRLRDGEGVQLASDGTVTDDSSQPIRLVGPTAFQDALARRLSTQFRSWQDSVDTLRHDPRLIAHYLVDPDEGWSRRLINRASIRFSQSGIPVAGDGAVVAAERTEDRWGRKGGGLDFSRMGSRVRVMVPGEHHGLSLMCWVKINSLDRMYNSLFLTDGHEGREPHWQILDDGRLFFSVKPPDIDTLPSHTLKKQVFHSEPFWNNSMSGQWIMLCTVYDVDKKQVSHYLNGEQISNESISDDLLVDSIKIGAASICNWSEPMYRTDPTFVVRNLNGSIDEFALFSGALSSDEISTLYQAGTPNDR